MTANAKVVLGRASDALPRSRRFVVEWAEQAGLHELADDAELVTSELVTNALLHTDTPVTVKVGVDADTLRVEVHDECSELPVPGVLRPDAMSGRGLLLVERLTQRWGVTRVPVAGKCVWFELVAGRPTEAEELTGDALLDLWDLADDFEFDVSGPEEGPGELEPAEPTRRVRLEGVSARTLMAAKSHIDDLVREFSLAVDSEADGSEETAEMRSVATRLCALSVELLPFRNEMRRQAVEAAHTGQEKLTLELDLPPSLRPKFQEYQDVLDRADELCQQGRTLLGDCAGEHVEFRRWKLRQILAQLA